MSRNRGRALAALLSASTLLTGLVLTATSAAASTTPVATLNSQFLGGDIAVGTTRLGDVRVVLNNLPNLSANSCGTATPSPTCIPNDDVVIGDTLAQTSNGGQEYGIGAVWNDTQSSACGLGLWTLEAGSGNVVGPLPLPTGDLSPSNVQAFGGHICLSPGGSEAIETYDSTGHNGIVFEAGPTIATEQVVGRASANGFSFFAAGKGVDVSSGTVAGDLPTGTLASFGASGLTQLSSNRGGSHQTRITFAKGAVYAVVGTVSGLGSTPTNPITLQPSFAGAGSASTVSVP